MSLTGTQIGPYRVGPPLGSGAMGEVYRAHDSNLGRDVAIKLLPLDVSQDADRRARVEREARLLAALHHPHIATIFAVEHTARGLALVMELVEGPTLAERIAGGPLPARDALPIARQIAEALDAAHEKGIVHRDLKPANIKLTAGGQVKVLDFGLATAGESAASGGSIVATQLVSQPGTIVGTAQYMSPEQARGHVVDKRTDIWAFGCVLYELLTARPVFDGQTSSDVMAKVIEREPAWNVLPAGTPPGVRRLLERCLDKDPKRRLRDIGDAGREIDDAMVAPVQPIGQSGHRANQLAWAAALAVTAVVFGLLAWRFTSRLSSASTSAPVARLVVMPAEPMPLTAEGIVAISPDGRRLAYVAGRDARRQLFVRGLDDFVAKPIPGTEGADSPVFSPDGEWLAFVADQKVKKVALAGGPPQTLAESVENLGLDWGPDNSIFFIVGRAGSGMWRVSASGGSPTLVTTLGPRDTGLLSPHVLPDGKALLFSALIGSTSAQEIYVLSLQGGERRAIAKGAAPRYLSSGHVVFLQAGTLLAMPFDPVRLEATGAPVVVSQGVRQTGLGTPQFGFSKSGTMVYVPASGGARQDALVWVDRQGMEQPAGLSGGIYEMPRLSPDGRRVALQMASGAGASTDLWLHDLGRDTLSRLTFDGSSLFPLWAPDGRRIAFSSSKTGRFIIFSRTFDGGPQEELLPARQPVTYPLAWSPDGQSLAIVSVSLTTANDIQVFDTHDHGAPRPFVETPFREGAPTFSHDGRWVAYVSDQSGRQEIYMRPFPGPGGEITISTEGGNEPVWARQTGQLFYRHGTTMMAVDIVMSPALAVGKPHALFDKPYNAQQRVLAQLRRHVRWPAFPDAQERFAGCSDTDQCRAQLVRRVETSRTHGSSPVTVLSS